MANTSSQSIRCESDTLAERPVMPQYIFDAVMKGNNDMLIECLQLYEKEQTKIQEDGDPDHEIALSTKDLLLSSEIVPLTQRTLSFATRSPKITTEASHSASQQIKAEHETTVQSDLQSATGFGDTVLHLLVTKCHNELALKVFQRDISLLKVQNKMLDTPLHYAAKVGNEEIIQMLIGMEPSVVKDVLQQTNEKGDTALHVAVRYNFEAIIISLMLFDPKMAYKVNNEMKSPLYIAIDEKDYSNAIARNMIEVDSNLACTQFFDGTFPIHLATSKPNSALVGYLVHTYRDYAELVDTHGRNLCHVAAEVGVVYIIKEHVRLRNMSDYEGNTPMHIAAMKGDIRTLRSIWRSSGEGQIFEISANWLNKQGLNPYELSKRRLLENTNEIDNMASRIWVHEKTYGERFSEEWFEDIMEPPMKNKLERNQVIGLGSVLITTVTFAAAYTIPGGYKQDNGTPVLGRRYMFLAFILANALSFILGFLSLFALLIDAVPSRTTDTLLLATILFLFAASSMVVAFGLGLYVTISPVCLPIAILLLVVTLFISSPAQLYFYEKERYVGRVTNFLNNIRTIVGIYVGSLLLIFCLALLYL